MEDVHNYYMILNKWEVLLSDISTGLKTAYNQARKNQPIKHINEFVDKALPASIKANLIYNEIKQTTKALKQAGFRMNISIIGAVHSNAIQFQPILAKQVRKQNGTGKKKSKRNKRN